MGRSDTEAQSILRFGLGHFSSRCEVDYVTGRVINLVEHLRVDGRNEDANEYTEKTVEI